jgi:hypothetical protein
MIVQRFKNGQAHSGQAEIFVFQQGREIRFHGC